MPGAIGWGEITLREPLREAIDGEGAGKLQVLTREVPTSLVASQSEPSLSQAPSSVRLRPTSGQRFFADERSCFKRLPKHHTLVETGSRSASSRFLRTSSKDDNSGSTGSLPARPVGSSGGGAGRLRSHDLSVATLGRPPGGGDGGSNMVVPVISVAEEDDLDLPSTALPNEEKTARVLLQLYPCSSTHEQPVGPALNSTASVLAGTLRGASTPSRRKAGKGKELRMDASVSKVRLNTDVASTAGGATTPACASTWAAGCGGGLANVAGEVKSVQHRLLWCRQKLLEGHSTLHLAMEKLAGEERGMGREFTRKDFSWFLRRQFPALPRDEHNGIFANLAGDSGSAVSMSQFHIGMEAAVSVRSVEDLRRRLLALGFKSIRQALSQLQDESLHTRRLSAAQFGAALAGVGKLDEEEQRSIFAAVCDPNGGDIPPTVCVDELCSALAAVSPSLILEELRDRLLRRYESLAGACDALSIDAGAVGVGEFVAIAREAWKISPAEAHKIFRAVDLLRRGQIHRRELLRALRLAEPCLFLEEVRRRVRQRFLSIQGALQESDPEVRLAGDGRPTSRSANSRPTSRAEGVRPGSRQRCVSRGAMLAGQLADLTSKDAKRSAAVVPWGIMFSSKRFDVTELRALLASVQLPEADTQLLFNLLEGDRDCKLTLEDFAWGLRVFAPACALESMRLRCLASHSHIAEAFAGLPEELVGATLSAVELQEVLQARGLRAGADVEHLLDVLEPRPGEGTTVSGFVAALQAAAPGYQVPLAPEQRIAKAHHLVHGEMAPFHRSIKEARAEVRRRPRRDDGGRRRACEVKIHAEQQPQEQQQLQRACSSPTRRQQHRRDGPGGSKALCSGKGGKDDLALRGEPMSPPMRQSYTKVSDMVKIAASSDPLQTSDSAPFLERLHGYYANAGNTVANDVSLLATAQSRLQVWRNVSGHNRALGRSVF